MEMIRNLAIAVATTGTLFMVSFGASTLALAILEKEEITVIEDAHLFQEIEQFLREENEYC